MGSNQINSPESFVHDFHVSLFFFLFCTQNFKREEQNFVVQNEINNLGFLTGEGKPKMSKVRIGTNQQFKSSCSDEGQSAETLAC